MPPFIYDPTKTDPVAVANRDKQMVVVDQILDMQGDLKDSRKDLYFKVRWKDCTEQKDSWEPYSNLRHNIVLHAHIVASRLRHLIPR